MEDRYLLILSGLKTTAIISVFAILFGTILGALICFLRMAKNKLASTLAKLYISLIRGLPVLVLLMVIFYIVFAKIDIDPLLVAVLAFGINFGAYVSEMFRSAIESIDKGQTEAGIAGGFTKTQTFIYIVMPQAIRQVLPVYKGELISLVKMTSIVGYIAVQDLTKASDIIRSRTFDAFFPLITTAVLYFLISASLLWLLNLVERRTDPKRKRKASRKKRFVVIISVLLVTLGVIGIVPIVFQQNSVKNTPITSLSQLDGKRICVMTGTTGDFVVRERFEKAKVLDLVNPVDAALAVGTNKADAFVFDKITLQYLAGKSDYEFEIIPERLSTVDIVIPMKKNDKVLRQKINSAIEKLQDDGTLDQMYQKWFTEVMEEIPPMPQIKLDGKNGTLKMGTCLMSEPFAFNSHGKMVGFDIELAYRLAEILGVKLEILDMSYDAMIASLHAEKIDIAIANFYKLKEREKMMAFSIPYLQNDISALVRREK